jgi:lipopolysaccharide export LptBFGC system permease protein LptF
VTYAVDTRTDRNKIASLKDALSLANDDEQQAFAHRLEAQSVRQLAHPHSNVTMARIVLILALLVAAASAFVTPASHAGEY